MLPRAARELREKHNDIARLFYKAHLRGKGEEASEILVDWLLGETDKKEAIRKLRQLLGEKQEETS